MNYVYKKIEKEDCLYLYSLFKVKEYKDIFFEHNSTLKSWENRYYHIQDFELIYDEGIKVGVIHVKEFPYSVELLLLAIDSLLLRKGIGTKVISDLEDRFNKPLFKLNVKESNIRAVSFYKKMGYIQKEKLIENFGENGNHYILKMEKVKYG